MKRRPPQANAGADAPVDKEQRVLAAWQANAAPWTRVVRAGSIASRREVTDAAIIAAVREHQPRSVLDIGCGEGWLLRALGRRIARRLGVDAVPALIDAARAAGAGHAPMPGHTASAGNTPDDAGVACDVPEYTALDQPALEYAVLDYADLAAGALSERFDVVVSNFALLGQTSVDQVFRAVPSLLAPGGVFIVQTLHPVIACGEQPYRDGWREGSWACCGSTGEGGFAEAAPWYFRTLGSWLALVQRHGLTVVDCREPLWPASGQPASLLLIAASAAVFP